MSTTLLLVTGAELDLEGSPEEVAKVLEDASRSTSGTLAWLRERATKAPLGVNPAQVVAVRAG
jgi:hypothetical protein